MPRRTASIDSKRIRERLVSLLRVASITGDEEDAINRMATWLQEMGAEVDYWYDGMAALQRDPRYPGHEVERAWVPVVAGVVRGARPGPTVMLTGHVDVVPPGDYSQWEHEPFSGVVDGDKIYGCGAADMKSGMVAALEAFEAFAAGSRDFPGRVLFVAVPAEEDSGLGTLAAIRRGWSADAAIIPEPTTSNGTPSLVVAHAGAMSLTIQVPGLAAHASKRLSGESAIDHFQLVHEAIRADERRTNEAEDHPLMRDLKLPYASNIGLINGGTWSSSVMEAIQAEVRIGIPLSQTVEQAEQRFREAILERTRDNPWLAANPPRINRKAAGFGSAETPTDHPLVTTLAETAERVLGRETPLVGAPYGCDMSGWVRLAGVPTVVYGPGDIEWAHSANEWASLETIEDVARVLAETTENLLQLDKKELRDAAPQVQTTQ